MALAANALTTVETLCGELGIDVPANGSATERDLQRRIAVASSAIERYCDRIFAAAEVTENVRGYGTDVLALQRFPVTAVASVSLYGVEVDSSAYVCAGRDAEVGFIRAVCGPWEDTARWQSGGAPEPMAGTEAYAYSVTYSAGWTLPKDAADFTLPPEIEDACLQECVAAYRSKGRDVGIRSETMLGASVSYDTAATARGTSGLLSGVERILTPYKRSDF